MAPTTLRDHLQAGGRLHFDAHRDLIDALSCAGSWTDDHRADRALTARYDADTLADGGELYQGRHLIQEQRAETAQAQGFLADYLETYPDPELDSMIHAALPGPPSLHLEAQARPHQVHVGAPDGDDTWSCDNCGATVAGGDASAMLITDRPGHSQLHRDIVICRGCVTAVADSLATDTTDRDTTDRIGQFGGAPTGSPTGSGPTLHVAP